MKKENSTIKKILMLVCLCCTTAVMAQDENTERWKPEWNVDFTSEQQVTHHGKYNFANLLRLGASLPLCQGLSFDVASLSTYMVRKESIGGDLQTYSNLDAENIPFTFSLLGMNYQWRDAHTLFFGIRNMNEDYFSSPITSFFTNSSCGIYPTISANYPIANYPVASVGAHYRYEKSVGKGLMVVQGSCYNGVASRRFVGRDNVFRFCPHGDGVFALVQMEYQCDGSAYFLGNALYANGGTSATPWAYIEQTIAPQLTLIAGYSHAFGDDAVACKDFAGIGLHYRVGKAELGVFSDYARFSEGNEFATELSCKLQFGDHLSLQPTVHLISTSDAESSNHDFLGAASLRLGVSF